MNDFRKPNVVVTKMSPLVINDSHYVKEFGSVTLEKGGYILISSDCSFSIDELKKTKEVPESVDIIVKGADGDAGKAGQNGEDGKAGAVAHIAIKNLESSLNVQVYGGGEGGHGGLGGDGGSGGNGAFGAAGGNGGDGQDGTSGGNAGSGGALTIIYETQNDSQITGAELCSAGGEAGIPGCGGKGGMGKTIGVDGKDGAKGQKGATGEAGKLTVEKKGEKHHE